ncbi:MAG TPA: LuxR C-terminal-related transcriptional regulator [Nocardioides sp.]|uniref:LuxR C-terminal-related transcriptional regulator n=1 Tax=Nocardioides sp. TaxID=35761 RepID=UPI002E3048E1|nr:LuxR C-terminal-related transcriptional regulator [Nocardioides sp.]HEX5086297.1 LuxR C-terminal-related transcriptional regulator [Nocardioides sp.]
MPTAPRHFVRRPRLVGLLDDLADYPVTALVAPAGAGKTALAADWIRSTDRRAVWLALDDSDRDPQQLMTALAASVDQLAPGAAETTMDVLRRPHEPEDAVHALVEALEGAEVDRAVLVIDDVHLVDDEAAASSSLASFIEHKPDWLDLLLVSRRQLKLPVDRLRAAGALADLTFDALRFSDDEAMAMLTGLCPDLSAEDVPDLARSAGGWAAALQLIALAVRSHRVAGTPPPDLTGEAPAGSGRLVDQYLWHEVLSAERPELIDMLLAVSVVDRVNYSLAEALTGHPEAGDILAEAERRGLFVTALESGGWFEVHGLVRELLLAEFERRWPERLRERHARAARWFETADDSTSAVEHWLAAGMPREALRLLSDLAVDLFESGREPLIHRMLAGISPSFSDTDVDALIEFAWCQLHVDRRAFEVALAAAESAAPADEATVGRLLVLRAASAMLAGDVHRSERLARQALDTIGELRLGSLGRFGWTLVAHGIALAERWQDGAPDIGQVRLGVSRDPGRSIALEGTRAIGLALAGHPLDAVETSAGVRRIANTEDMSSLRTELSLADAIATRELGDREQARQLLEGLSAQPSYPLVFVQVLAQLELVELHLSKGDVDDAETVFGLASENCERAHHGPGAISELARRGVLLGLARGDHDAAAHWTQRIDDPFWRPLSDARVELASRHLPEAAEALTRAVPRSARHRVISHLMLARTLRDSQRASAEKEVARAVEIAAERGMLQTVGSEGLELLDLLELAAWRVPEGWMRRLRHVVVGSEDLKVSPGILVDELTARERDVLRLLPTRLTVREIAGELYVSRNTVKFHLRVIYQKLGVSSRAEAVQTARSLGLLRSR